MQAAIHWSPVTSENRYGLGGPGGGLLMPQAPVPRFQVPGERRALRDLGNRVWKLSRSHRELLRSPWQDFLSIAIPWGQSRTLWGRAGNLLCNLNRGLAIGRHVLRCASV